MNEWVTAEMETIYRQQLDHFLRADLGTVATRISQVNGGLSSAVWKVSTSSGDFAFRGSVSNQRTGGSSRADAHVLAAAGEAGIAPELICISPDYNFSLTRWIEGCPGTSGLFVKNKRALSSALENLRSLNECSALVPSFSPSQLIRRYLNRADLSAVTATREQVEKLLDRMSLMEASIPDITICHNDAMPKNCVWDGSRTWLLDYEFAGPFDPLWDIATLLNETDLNTTDLALLRDPRFHLEACQIARVRKWIPLVDGLWALYALAMESGDGALTSVARRRWSRYVRSTYNVCLPE